MTNNLKNSIYSREILWAATYREKKGFGVINLATDFELGAKHNIYPACLSGFIENYESSKFFTG